jgi:hypothetical protein
VEAPAAPAPANKQAQREVINTDGRFIAYSDGTVLDKQTNLMWAAKDEWRDATREDAKRQCETYRGGGYSDWRMPTLNELARLYDASVYRHNSNHMTSLISLSCSNIWASETRGSKGAVFSFDNGGRFWEPQINWGNSILPVRSNKIVINEH